MDDKRAQADAIAEFAAILRELRKSVGNPPFREMSGRSGAISHTTLHEATKGNRLPSWGTTVEFVKACGADPEDYRERWEAANRAVRSGGASSGEPAASAAKAVAGEAAHLTDRPQPSPEGGASAPSPSPPPPDAPAAETEPPAPPPDPGGGRERPRFVRPAVAALAMAAVAASLVTVIALTNDSDPKEKDDRTPLDGMGQATVPQATASPAALSPADCPVPPTNPPPAPPLHPGDAARFIADVTLPDCTRVPTAKTVTKVWRLKNAGKVPWEGYSLRRLDMPQRADQCQTISDIPIPDTEPGEMVDIRAHVTTPRKPGLCYVRFKVVDSAGRVVFPGSRPVNFQIIVE